MTGSPPYIRPLLAASLSMALAALTAGCSGGSPSTAATPTPSHSAAVPGRIHVEVADIDLTVTDAVAHLDRSGNGSLTMRVRNDDGVPEHLAMVSTPDGGRADLTGGKSTQGNGSLSTAGILLLSGTTVTFHGKSGPSVLLHHVHGVTAGRTLPVSLQFGVAGLIHLQARVSSS
ncbi:hypothetical protein ACIRJO_27035 [Streptomyces sp. NPDC102394]|uniref:hypothetical protein n=1 Tax=Streptomyces sp. NPDC102394 TaxID=3366167 RepID=UPI00382E1D98